MTFVEHYRDAAKDLELRLVDTMKAAWAMLMSNTTVKQGSLSLIPMDRVPGLSGLDEVLPQGDDYEE